MSGLTYWITSYSSTAERKGALASPKAIVARSSAISKKETIENESGVQERE
jgi:hypothetical protein